MIIKWQRGVVYGEYLTWWAPCFLSTSLGEHHASWAPSCIFEHTVLNTTSHQPSLSGSLRPNFGPQKVLEGAVPEFAWASRKGLDRLGGESLIPATFSRFSQIFYDDENLIIRCCSKMFAWGSLHRTDYHINLEQIFWKVQPKCIWKSMMSRSVHENSLGGTPRENPLRELLTRTLYKNLLY